MGENTSNNIEKSAHEACNLEVKSTSIYYKQKTLLNGLSPWGYAPIPFALEAFQRFLSGQYIVQAFFEYSLSVSFLIQ